MNPEVCITLQSYSIIKVSMEYRRYIIMLSLFTLAMVVRAQVAEDRKRLHKPDSVKSDFEEWLRNEPLRPEHHDSTTISPLPPSMSIPDPMDIKPGSSSVSIPIMTPALRTDMQLAAQGHWLEEQRKSQVGGAMTIGVNPLSLISYVFHKIFPRRKSKKQRERERLKQILDNY